MKSGIYKIQIGANFYLGSAVNLKNRERQHRGELRAGKHANRFMQRAWDKHGEMQFDVVEFCKVADIINREQNHISRCFGNPKCMNLSPTAGNTLGVKHTEKARRNMSIAHKGKMAGADHPLFGKPRSAETRGKLSVALTGRKFTDETRVKHKAAMNHPGVKIRMAMAHIGRKQSAEWVEKRTSKTRGCLNGKARGVRLFFPNGENAEYETIAEAEKVIGTAHPSLSKWLNGKAKWPGCGHKKRGKYEHLNGLKGEYTV